MIIHESITISRQTPVTQPNTKTVFVGAGTLSRVVVESAPGCNWEIYFSLLHLENSIIPDNSDQWIPLSGGKLEFYPGFNDWHNVHALTIRLCSPQARYNHTIQVSLEVTEHLTVDESLERLLKAGLG